MCSPPTSIPSYNCCAINCVRLVLNFNLANASCCKVEVVNGSLLSFVLKVFSTLTTFNLSGMPARISLASFSLLISIFSPFLPTKVKSNSWLRIFALVKIFLIDVRQTIEKIIFFGGIFTLAIFQCFIDSMSIEKLKEKNLNISSIYQNVIIVIILSLF